MGFSTERTRGKLLLWPFFRSERATRFCATSAIAAWSLRHRSTAGAHVRSPCDVLRLNHEAGVMHYINLLSMGFSADVATLRARRFSGVGRARLPVFYLYMRSRDFGAGHSPCESMTRRNRSPPLSVSDFQQQQIHRRHDDDRSESRR